MMNACENTQAHTNTQTHCFIMKAPVMVHNRDCPGNLKHSNIMHAKTMHPGRQRLTEKTSQIFHCNSLAIIKIMAKQ